MRRPIARRHRAASKLARGTGPSALTVAPGRPTMTDAHFRISILVLTCTTGILLPEVGHAAADLPAPLTPMAATEPLEASRSPDATAGLAGMTGKVVDSVSQQPIVGATVELVAATQEDLLLDSLSWRIYLSREEYAALRKAGRSAAAATTSKQGGQFACFAAAGLYRV